MWSWLVPNRGSALLLLLLLQIPDMRTDRGDRSLARARRLHRGLANGRYRRVSPVAVRPGEGLLTEPTAATQP